MRILTLFNRIWAIIFLRIKWTGQELIDCMVEWYYDTKLGIETHGMIASPKNSKHGDSMRYEAVKYQEIKNIFAALYLTYSDIIMDIGCGKGRILFYAAQFEIQRCIGIELQEDTFKIAVKNSQTNKNYKCRTYLHLSDACNYNYTKETIFFFFNPFTILTLSDVLIQIHQSIMQYPRKIQIVYYFGTHNEIYEYLNGLSWLIEKHKRETFVIYTN